MGADDQQRQLDRAFDRIEETILPCIAMMLESLLDAVQPGGAEIMPQAYAAELRTLALQLETLTREIEAISPARLAPHRTVSAARR